MSARVCLNNITLSYARHPAVHHVSGSFAPGTLTAVVGPNGAGKSTLIKAIAGVLPVREGELRIEGVTREQIAYLPQASQSERDFPISALNLVVSGAWRQAGGFSAISPSILRRAEQALGEVGLHGYGKRSLSTLSAGQFQRVLFARLLMQDAKLIILDEPFTALDEATTTHLLQLIARWPAEGRTVICVLHDAAQVRRYFPECLLLARECIAWGPTADVLSPARLGQMRFFVEPAGEDALLCEQAV